MNSVLEVIDLEKNYPEFKLEDIDFTLEEGYITGFIGINGAGKTTTLKTILGLTSISKGKISFWGKDLFDHHAEIKNRIGVVLGENCFFESLTIDEMKSIIAPAYSQWDERVFKSYLEKFSLNPKQVINSLSKGMKVKFSLAIALSHHADLLIMDEPTSGLDPLIRKQLMNILLEFMEQENKSVFFSTHITSDLDKVADKIILIDEGRIIFNREKDELLETHKIVKGNPAYLREEDKKLFNSLQISEYGFKGLTDKANLIADRIKDVVIEKPLIEDIMLGYIST